MLKLFLTMVGESSGILLETQKKFGEAYLKALKDEVARMEGSVPVKKEVATKEDVEKKIMEEDFNAFPNAKRWRDLAYARRERGIWNVGVHEEVAKAFSGEKTSLQEVLEKDSKQPTGKESIFNEMVEDTRANLVMKKIIGD